MGIYNLIYSQEVVININKFNELRDELNKYINNPVLPKKIACKIKRLLSKVQEKRQDQKIGSYVKNPSFIECSSNPEYKSYGMIILRQYIGEIIVVIDDWLRENQVKDINLPQVNKEYIRRHEKDLQ